MGLSVQFLTGGRRGADAQDGSAVDLVALQGLQGFVGLFQQELGGLRVQGDGCGQGEKFLPIPARVGGDAAEVVLLEQIFPVVHLRR